MHIVHPLLRPGMVEFRGYQANLARVAGKHDTLVVLPTGLGKTVVAVLAIADALQAGAQRILILAPTRPLVDQHGHSLREVLAPPWSERVHVLTGNMGPARRAAAYAEPGIVVATPQAVQNDVVGGTLRLEAVDWVVFDEAHRAIGDYPYTFLGEELRRRAPRCRRLGLTASPGHDVQRIDAVRHALGLTNIEVRTSQDADVAPYIQDVAITWETLPMPPAMARVSARLHEALRERVDQLRALGFLKGASSRPNRRELLELARLVSAQLGSEPNPDTRLFTALSLQAQALKLHHAIEQAETQGSAAFAKYIESVREEARSGRPSKATQSFLADARVNEAYHVARLDTGENPKLGRAGELVREAVAAHPDARAIVFAQYRTTCETIAAHLAAVPGVRPVVFVGQQRRGASEGMSQKVQKETLDTFRQGGCNVLVATSVAEEGLDIPSTDLVVFYEPIPSEIRAIQRRGRTGRHREGKVVVLMTKGSADEASHYASRRKEQMMARGLQDLRLSRNPALAPPQPKPAGGWGQAPLPSAATPAPGPPAGLPAAAPAGRPTALAVGALQPPASAGGTPPEAPKATPGPAVRPQMPAHEAAAGARPAVAPASALTPGPPPASGRAAASQHPHATTIPRTAAQQATLPPAEAGQAEAAGDALRREGLAPPPRIVYDHREQSGAVVRGLHALGVRLEARQLEVGDFVLSDRVVAERKSMRDFVDSLVDGRLFPQLRSLKAYPRPLLVLEGDSLLGHRNLSAEALYGALASVTVDYGIPVLQARDGAETARLLAAIAKREQSGAERKVAVRPGKGPMSDAERLVFILGGFPGVSDLLAQRLLSHFGSLQAVLDADAARLAAVEGIGSHKAGEIRRLLELDWLAPPPVRTETV